MNQNLKIRIFSFVKKLTTIAILLFVFTFIEMYWAMGSLSERISSENHDSHFFDDAYLISIFTTIFLTIVFLPFTFIKNKYLKIGLEIICLISIWFLWNYYIFVVRESSWSTYLFREEILHTLALSFLPLLVLSIILVSTLNYILRKL